MCAFAQARILVLFLPPDAVATLACTCREWRAAAAADVWAQKHAALRRRCPHLAPLPGSATPAQAFAALAAAQDTAHAVPGARMAIAHWDTPDRYWEAASVDLADEAAGALFPPSEVAVCRAVCWLDVRARITLPPGAWLLRWRLRVASPLGAETFTLSTEATVVADASGNADAARTAAGAAVIVTPVPRALAACRSPPRTGGAWAPVWVAPGGASGASSSTAAAAPQLCVEAQWTPRQGPQHTAWLYLPAAVVHLPRGCAAEVAAALFKHTNWWTQGLFLDCLQAVPLDDAGAVFGPLPVALLPAGPPGFATDAFTPAPCAPTPAVRWAGPHWATRRV